MAMGSLVVSPRNDMQLIGTSAKVACDARDATCERDAEKKMKHWAQWLYFLSATQPRVGFRARIGTFGEVP